MGTYQTLGLGAEAVYKKEPTMHYKTVRIYPKGDTWDYSISGLLHEREDKPTLPSANGWYHAPVDMPDAEALEALKACMVQRHKDEINRITRSMEALCGLSF